MKLVYWGNQYGFESLDETVLLTTTLFISKLNRLESVFLKFLEPFKKNFNVYQRKKSYPSWLDYEIFNMMTYMVGTLCGLKSLHQTIKETSQLITRSFKNRTFL